MTRLPVERAIRFALSIGAIFSVIIAWGYNPLAAASGDGVTASLMSAVSEIMITFLLVYLIWQVSKVIIDKKIAEEDAAAAGNDVPSAEEDKASSEDDMTW